MKTIAKTAIFKMIEAANQETIYEFEIESIRKSKNTDGTFDWSFSVYQVKHTEGEPMEYRSLLSDPTIFTGMAKAMGAGSYISVDTIGKEPEDYEDQKASTWGKPYVRLY